MEITKDTRKNGVLSNRKLYGVPHIFLGGERGGVVLWGGVGGSSLSAEPRIHGLGFRSGDFLTGGFRVCFNGPVYLPWPAVSQTEEKQQIVKLLLSTLNPKAVKLSNCLEQHYAPQQTLPRQFFEVHRLGP